MLETHQDLAGNYAFSTGSVTPTDERIVVTSVTELFSGLLEYNLGY
ncbi:hypothetical protein Z949_2465 [Sulfitobacter guttiformis KCTC 32187]|nr:hypothetical protein Z949_2465 [Sulfitobacter guttiformis KCTC 32187]